MARSNGDEGGPENRPGSVAAWIDDLWSKGEWRLMKIKRIHDEIVNAAENRGIPDPPSYTAVRDEVNLGAWKTKRGKRGKRGRSG